ncbi:MAG: M28 family peptidase [Leptospiraceae bacterium]|nr:M28 family peptidase [Leptospiraceae bacterium]MCB1303380.1 M28 family peptidase [Leptospiraceae bacterium]
MKSGKILNGPLLFLLGPALILCMVFVAWRVGQQPDDSHSAEDFFSLPSDNISRVDLEYYVHVLSGAQMGGRESGRDSGKQATRFLLEQYKGSGLKGFFDGAFEQKFSFPAGIKQGQDSHAWFGTDVASLASEPAKIDVIPVGFAAPSFGEGPLVFGGYCVSAPARGFDELARINVYGKVVLCLRYGPGGKHGEFDDAISFRSKYEALKKRGAAGVIFLRRPETPPVQAAMFSGSSEVGPPSVIADPDFFYDNVEWLADEDSEDTDAKTYSTHLGEQIGWIRIHMDYETEQLEGINIGASLKGAFKPGQSDGKKWIVVGAHYDHLGLGEFGSLDGPGEIHNGADDNASGTAAVLEVAHSLKKLYAANPGLIPDPYDVVFLHFDAEERGLFGSEHFVSSEYFSGSNVVAMLNLDMVGMLREGKGLQMQGAQTGDESWKKMIEEAFASVRFSPGTELRFFPGGNGPSDHSPFYRKDVPIAFFFTGEHPYYHKSTDDFDRLNYRGLFHISQMAQSLVLAIARQGAPEFRKAPEVSRYDLEFNVRLGIIPGGYGETEGGLLVEGVKDDAPIARTGIQKGDRIIFLGDRKIENIRDLTEFLYQARLNTVYEIHFKRGDQVIKSKTTLIAGSAH